MSYPFIVSFDLGLILEAGRYTSLQELCTFVGCVERCNLCGSCDMESIENESLASKMKLVTTFLYQSDREFQKLCQENVTLLA